MKGCGAGWGMGVSKTMTMCSRRLIQRVGRGAGTSSGLAGVGGCRAGAWALHGGARRLGSLEARAAVALRRSGPLSDSCELPASSCGTLKALPSLLAGVMPHPGTGCSSRKPMVSNQHPTSSSLHTAGCSHGREPHRGCGWVVLIGAGHCRYHFTPRTAWQQLSTRSKCRLTMAAALSQVASGTQGQDASAVAANRHIG